MTLLMMIIFFFGGVYLMLKPIDKSDKKLGFLMAFLSLVFIIIIMIGG